MEITLTGDTLKGKIALPVSKSVFHRAIIAAGLSETAGIHTKLSFTNAAGCSDTLTANVGTAVYSLDNIPDRVLCDDTRATLEAMRSLTGFGKRRLERAVINCRNSATTLRLLLPIAGALGIPAEFVLSDSLAMRPVEELLCEMSRHGYKAERLTGGRIVTDGQLLPGDYFIRGDISSQYISGLLMALPLLDGPSSLTVFGKIGSVPYISMTLKVQENSGLTLVEQTKEPIFDRTDVLQQEKVNHELTYYVNGPSKYQLYNCSIEPDWSCASYWRVAAAIRKDCHIECEGLLNNSLQGDSMVDELLSMMFQEPEAVLDMNNTPDLVPALAVAACAKNGRTVFTGVDRLIYKESNRCESVCRMIADLGGHAAVTDYGELSPKNSQSNSGSDVHDSSFSSLPDDYSHALIVEGMGRLRGGCVDSLDDHRIAMAASIAALICDNPVTICNAECVNKSYPGFFDDFRQLLQVNA